MYPLGKSNAWTVQIFSKWQKILPCFSTPEILPKILKTV